MFSPRSRGQFQTRLLSKVPKETRSPTPPCKQRTSRSLWPVKNSNLTLTHTEKKKKRKWPKDHFKAYRYIYFSPKGVNIPCLPVKLQWDVAITATRKLQRMTILQNRGRLPFKDKIFKKSSKSSCYPKRSLPAANATKRPILAGRLPKAKLQAGYVRGLPCQVAEEAQGTKAARGLGEHLPYLV